MEVQMPVTFAIIYSRQKVNSTLPIKGPGQEASESTALTVKKRKRKGEDGGQSQTEQTEANRFFFFKGAGRC